MALSGVPELIVTFSRKVANMNAENLIQGGIVQYMGQNSPRRHNSEELNISVLLLSDFLGKKYYILNIF
jgi:hypothetical protein